MRIAAFELLARADGPGRVDHINAGVEAGAFTSLSKALDLPTKQLADILGLNARHIKGRELLGADETERAFRTYRVLVRAEEVLEHDEIARR